MCLKKFKESVLWEDCPFCAETNVIRKVSFSLEPDGEETQTNKKWGEPHYEFKDHIIECQKIVGSFSQREQQFSQYYQKKLLNPKFKIKENKITKTILLQNYNLGRATETNVFNVKAFTPNDMPFLKVADFVIAHGKTLSLIDFPNPYEIEGSLKCQYLEKDNLKIFQFYHGISQEPAFWCSTKNDFS